MNGNWHTVYRPLVSAEPHVPPKLSAPTEPVSKQDWYHTSNTNAKSLDDTTSIRCLSSAIRLYGSATVSPEIWTWPSLWLTLYLLRISSALFSARCCQSYGLNTGLKRHVSIIFGIIYNLSSYHDQPKAKSARSRHAAFRSRYGLNKNSEKGSKITLRHTKMSSKLRNLVSNHSSPFGHTYVYLAAPSAVYTLLVYKGQTSYLTTLRPVAPPLPPSWFHLESDSSYRPFQAFFLTHSFLAWVRTQPHSFWISVSTCLFGSRSPFSFFHPSRRSLLRTSGLSSRKDKRLVRWVQSRLLSSKEAYQETLISYRDLFSTRTATRVSYKDPHNMSHN